MKWPSTVMRPTLAALISMNQIAPSGPSAPLWVGLLGVGTAISGAWPVAAALKTRQSDARDWFRPERQWRRTRTGRGFWLVLRSLYGATRSILSLSLTEIRSDAAGERTCRNK